MEENGETRDVREKKQEQVCKGGLRVDRGWRKEDVRWSAKKGKQT